MVDAWNERTFGSDAHPSRARLMQMDPDPTEIQGSADEIARSKVVQAWEEIRERVATPFGSEDRADAERPPDDALAKHPERYDFVVTEDVGLGMRCLNGFPGPYCKPMLEAIGPEGLWNLASRYDDTHPSSRVLSRRFARDAPKPATPPTRIRRLVPNAEAFRRNPGRRDPRSPPRRRQARKGELEFSVHARREGQDVRRASVRRAGGVLAPQKGAGRLPGRRHDPAGTRRGKDTVNARR